MKFKPCIDLHDGKVKQIVGATLTENNKPQTNFISDRDARWYANLYRSDNLRGGHVIKLGSGNDAAAKEALDAWPNGLQIGGGITAENAQQWLDLGAEKVIVTSYLFSQGILQEDRLKTLIKKIGREHLVLDLSCRKQKNDYWVVSDRWQTFTQTKIDAESIKKLETSCSEFLIHGVDVEGQQQGVDEELIHLLATHIQIPCTYAGGVQSLKDLEKIKTAGNHQIDVTVGSALDLFGGPLPYRDVIHFCNNTSC
jgi:phosphoribosylformimino-5-aminoimidazole carboxamide ribotide isomerase